MKLEYWIDCSEALCSILEDNQKLDLVNECKLSLDVNDNNTDSTDKETSILYLKNCLIKISLCVKLVGCIYNRVNSLLNNDIILKLTALDFTIKVLKSIKLNFTAFCDFYKEKLVIIEEIELNNNNLTEKYFINITSDLTLLLKII